MLGYIITVIVTAIASVTTAAVMTYKFVRLIQRRVKLSHSINLVELKTSKLVYLIFAGVIAALMFVLVMAMAYPSTMGSGFTDLFGVDKTLRNVAFSFPLMAIAAMEAFLVMLCIGKNAVVDKGVLTTYAMLDWHQVRDYVIDEERGILVLSANKGTFSTLKDLTAPFRVDKGDIEKIKFILNKNKNKFSGFDADGRSSTF